MAQTCMPVQVLDDMGSLFDAPLDWGDDPADDAFESMLLRQEGAETILEEAGIPTEEWERELDNAARRAAESAPSDAVRLAIAEYPKDDAGKLALHAERARDRGRRATLTLAQWQRLKRAFLGCCAYCGAKPKVLVVEHVVPLARSGHHELANVLPSCRYCNMDKMALDPLQWQRGDDFWSHFIPRFQAALKRYGRRGGR